LKTRKKSIKSKSKPSPAPMPVRSKADSKQKAVMDNDDSSGASDDDDLDEDEAMEDEKKEEEEDEEDEDEPSPPTSPVPASVNKDWKTLVISSQQFDGCWDDKSISNILGSSIWKTIQSEKDQTKDPKVWTTALALAILELKCLSSKTSWEVVANKGRAFMSKVLVTTEKIDKDEIVQVVMKLVTKAKEILSKLI